jgi:hypothetical protein
MSECGQYYFAWFEMSINEDNCIYELMLSYMSYLAIEPE